MFKVAIHGREVSESVEAYVKEVIDTLRAYQVEISVSEAFSTSRYAPYFEGFNRFSRVEQIDQFDFVLSLGGDGTFLETLTLVGPTEIPILGINTGRLGFLAPISREMIKEALTKLLKGRYEIDNRSLVSLEASGSPFGGDHYAINEFAMIRKDTSSMIAIKCYINEQYLATYWADGLMVSTPTGSTGYSLSCGGPIIMPHSGNFILTPVSPHNLNVRPLVLSDENEIRFEVDSRSTNFLISLDSRSTTVSDDISLKITKAKFKAKLLSIEGVSFIGTLRNKLNWGLDRRN
ncbi:MAG: NAD kinase [Cytophagales bacterium]|nr:NAD kinase [Cytophagales bacterium]